MSIAAAPRAPQNHGPIPTPVPAPFRGSTPGTSERAGASASCSGCAAKWPIDAAAVAHCASCHATFTSISSFDRHRVGDDAGRRCLTEDEMRAAGLAPNGLGRWRIPADEDAVARLRLRQAPLEQDGRAA